MSGKLRSHVTEKLFHYQGPFDSVKRDEVLQKIHVESKEYDLPEIILKRLYTVVEELLGNIVQHGIMPESAEDDCMPLITVLINNDELTVKSGNLVEQEHTVFLKSHIDHINEMRRSELKDYYQKQAKAAVISRKGGAGLGLITIAKTTRTKIDYWFKKINKDYSFFTVSAIIVVG